MEVPMRLSSLLISASAFVLVACAPAEIKPPSLPGYVNAPPPAMAAAGDSLLTETVWTWQGTQLRDGTRITPDDPERYTLVFQPGGKVNVRADCNRGATDYVLTGSALTFGPLALTRAACQPGSRDAEFVKNLAAVSGQRFSGNDLVLTLKADSGSMRFTTTRQ
jgi:heat shock protein HslJ